MGRLIAAAVALALAIPGWAMACAVPTRITLRNDTSQVLRAFYIDAAENRAEGPSTLNRLPPAGLAPGATVTVTFPSCIGVYTLRGIFADGSEQRHDQVDARRIRSLTLR